jgi:hypothetical protein
MLKNSGVRVLCGKAFLAYCEGFHVIWRVRVKCEFAEVRKTATDKMRVYYGSTRSTENCRAARD